MLAGIAQALAQYYGYKTISSLIGENFGLIMVMTAFVLVTLVFRRLLNRQFPKQGREPVKTWIFKTTTVFFICAFVFICVFTLFYEKKKLDKERDKASFLRVSERVEQA